MDEKPLVLKPEEAAKLLRIGRTKVYELIKDGTLPVIHLGEGGPTRIPYEALQDYIRTASAAVA